jgi:hypothetical protein
VSVGLSSFLDQIPDWNNRAPSDLIKFFLYYRTIIRGETGVTPILVDQCFDELRLAKYSNTSAFLGGHSNGGKARPGLFIKKGKAYQLERSVEDEIRQSLQSGPAKLQAAGALEAAMSGVSDPGEKAFLEEAIDCYRIEASRACIVLVWIVAIDHLCRHILNHKLNDFNLALSKVTNKKVKMTKVTAIDDFADIPEKLFIEISRSAGVISNDVRKILDAKLGIRNTCAHPSNVSISPVSRTSFLISSTMLSSSTLQCSERC